jgi:hypothetical protein
VRLLEQHSRIRFRDALPLVVFKNSPTFIGDLPVLENAVRTCRHSSLPPAPDRKRRFEFEYEQGGTAPAHLAA